MGQLHVLLFLFVLDIVQNISDDCLDNTEAYFIQSIFKRDQNVKFINIRIVTLASRKLQLFFGSFLESSATNQQLESNPICNS